MLITFPVFFVPVIFIALSIGWVLRSALNALSKNPLASDSINRQVILGVTFLEGNFAFLILLVYLIKNSTPSLFTPFFVIPVVFIAISIAAVVSSSVQALARNPDASEAISRNTLMGLVFLEANFIFLIALVYICL